jgi:iron complex transport system ATP-binding protein
MSTMPVEKTSMLDASEMSIGYRLPGKKKRVVADGIEISLYAGQLVCMLGPNGAGKSTLIRTLAGMQEPLAGDIRFEGIPMCDWSARERAQRMSMVLTRQQGGAGMMPAAALVALGRQPFTNWAGRLTRRDEEAVRQALRGGGGEELAHRHVGELSDGEQQEVMIARALAQEPRVMILDEATAFLDLPRRVELMQLLQKLATENGRAILLSTHDLDLALRHADRLWILPRGGHLRQGSPEDMVLSDALSDAFAETPELRFDKTSGAFKRRGGENGTVVLSGNGVAALWAARALERKGYRVIPDGDAPFRINVVNDNGAAAWEIRNAAEDKTAVCASIETLLEHIKWNH